MATPSVWYRDNETGVVTFNATGRRWLNISRTLPATGWVKTEFEPDLTLCQEKPRDCVSGALDLRAEQPFPCPVGYYCKSGVASDVPVPKNFSTPQVCSGDKLRE